MSLLITAIACAAALLCAFQIWRMMRDERRRSDARVAALAAVIDPPGSGRPPAIFDERTRMPASRHPLLKVAIGFAAVVTLIIVVAMANDLHDDVDQAPKPAPPCAVAFVTQALPRRSSAMCSFHGWRASVSSFTDCIRLQPSGMSCAGSSLLPLRFRM